MTVFVIGFIVFWYLAGISIEMRKIREDLYKLKMKELQRRGDYV
jgi:hypothetical protein